MIGSRKRRENETYHFKVIDLLPDLLGEQRSETIAGGDFAATIVFTAGPGLVELDARAEDDISTTDSLWGHGGALGVRVETSRIGKEVVFAGNLDRVILRGRSRGLIRGRGSTGVW